MTQEQAQPAPDKSAIRAELDEVRSGYHQLLDSLSESHWQAKSGNPAWKVSQLMWHLGRGMEFFSQSVGYCRKGKAPNPPAFLVNTGNVLLVRLGSRGASPASCAEKYETAHTALLAVLDGVQDDEWQKGATVFGTPLTVESSFRSAKEHFEEHQADIQRGLGRA